MESCLLTAALGVGCVSGFAQGTFNFANSGVGWQAKVFDTDGVTGLAGSAWKADLYWFPGLMDGDTLKLAPLNEPATFSTVPSEAGLFFGGQRTNPAGFPIITAQVRVWDTASGASYAIAAATPGARVGESWVFVMDLTGNIAPADMSGLNGHSWTVHFAYVPEPTTLNYQVSGVHLMLSWSNGVLQSSSQVNGTYIDTNATSPYSIPLGASGSQQYYRLRIP